MPTTWEKTYHDHRPVMTPDGEIIGYTALARQPDGRLCPAAGMTITAGALQIAMPLTRDAIVAWRAALDEMRDRIDSLGRRANVATITDHRPQRGDAK